VWSKVKMYAMKTYGGVNVKIHIFLTLALAGGEWSASHPSRFTPRGKSPRYPLDRRLGGLQSRFGQRRDETNLTLPGLELRTLGRPARSQSLYPLLYLQGGIIWLKEYSNVPNNVRRMEENIQT
jgi:hypothetical protein